MPATQYKIWQVGNPVGQGATRSFHVGIAAIAKGNSQNLPYVVTNELICANLGRMLLLPVPPGFIIEHNDEPHFVSLDFNLAGEDLPPITPGETVRQRPHLSTGIVLFDIWIVNSDRHTRNIAHDRDTDRVQIFDHSHAFFAGTDGGRHLDSNRDQLGIGNHCLASQLRSFQGIQDWNNRIQQLPEYYIRGLVENAADVGLPGNAVDFCTEFLLERRQQLLELIKANKDVFTSIEPRLFDDLDA